MRFEEAMIINGRLITANNRMPAAIKVSLPQVCFVVAVDARFFSKAVTLPVSFATSPLISFCPMLSRSGSSISTEGKDCTGDTSALYQKLAAEDHSRNTQKCRLPSVLPHFGIYT
jgi:hypothetical protein